MPVPHANQLAELLEPRCLLAVTPLIINNTDLLVQLESSDNVTIQADASGNLEVLSNGSLVIATPAVAVNTLTSISVFGGDGPNIINLTNVTTSAFAANLTVTVNGGDGSDIIFGSEFADSLIGGNGGDAITGALADDTIEGGNGIDTLSGGVGNDSLFGGDGADSIHGDAGNDTVVAGNGADQVFGDAGLDSLNGGDGSDTLSGDADEDTLSGDNGNDSLLGGTENDSILGGSGNDIASGGDGLDTLFGGADNDSMNGDLGNDSLDGGDGNDTLLGGDNNDTINGGTGNDTVNGDAGNDSLFGGAGNDSMVGGRDDDSVFGQAGNDTIVGDGGVDSLDGGIGNDLISSQSTLVGILINDVTISEGDNGSVNAIFTVGLTLVPTQTVTVNFSTSGGTAISGTDFMPITNGLLTFLANVTTQTISVPIIGDTTPEPMKFFSVNLSNAVNATIIDGSGQGTITDADAPSGVTITPSINVNASRLLRNQDESAIIINPTNSQQLFSFANNGRNGMFAARSVDAGQTWLPSFGALPTSMGADLIIADGNDALPAAISDPSLAWDSFGNLFLTYLSTVADVVVATSLDGGQSFSLLTRLGTAGFINNNPANPNNDQQTIVVGPGQGGIGTTVWVTYSDQVNNRRVIHGATVTGAGMVSGFSVPQPSNVGNFGDITVGPNGQVVVTGQTNTAIQVQTDPDGLGPMPFGLVTSLPVNVALFEVIPAQPTRMIDAEVGLAYDLTSGRLYMLYTEEPVDNSDDTEIFSRFSMNDGATFSLPVRVNDDVTNRSQFFSKIAVDQTTGVIGAAWYDARNSANNTTVQAFVSVSIDGGLTWQPNVLVSAGTTNGTIAATMGQQLGDYMGLTFNAGQLHPSWADNSNSTGPGPNANPDGTLNALDIYTNRVNVAITTSGGLGGVNVGTQLPSTVDVGDTLLGGDGNDTIVGADGLDFVNGNAGNDSLIGGLGNDSMQGGAGNDTLDGGLGNDTLDGQSGNDRIAGGDGSDTYIWNGAGNGVDTLSSLSGYDRVRVQGTDAANNYVVSQVSGQLQITDGTAVLNISPIIQVVDIFAGLGNDRITINALDRVRTATLLTINGEDGNDKINSNGANLGFVRVSLVGGLGDDTLIGGSGIDSLDGGDGDDSLNAQGGNDLVFGGIGDDTIIAGTGNDRVFGGDGNDNIDAGAGDDSVVGEVGADTIAGQDGNDTIDGGDGTDIINGGSGNDSILGGNEADDLNGSTGNDTVRGGASDDTIIGENGNDSLFGEDGNDSILGYDGDDTLSGGDGDDTLDGMAGNDLVGGGNGDDLMNGAAGNDTLTGGDGNDTIAGGAGNDVLLGDEGDDSLNGQGSTDIINPGEGANTVLDPITEIDTTFMLSAALLAALA